MKILVALLVLILGFAIWVRLAPSDPARWHSTLEEPQERVSKTGALRIIADSADQLGALEAIVLDTPRTRALAGSLADGHLTFITRSRVWGFPDYASIWIDGDDIIIWSRLRFGGGDMGVNKARIDNWIEMLSAP